jgi:hypothetical protein
MSYPQDENGRIPLHCMLKKNSDEPHFRMIVRNGARGDIPDHSGQTAAEIMGRKRSLAFRRMASQLTTG